MVSPAVYTIHPPRSMAAVIAEAEAMAEVTVGARSVVGAEAATPEESVAATSVVEVEGAAEKMCLPTVPETESAHPTHGTRTDPRGP